MKTVIAHRLESVLFPLYLTTTQTTVYSVCYEPINIFLQAQSCHVTAQADLAGSVVTLKNRFADFETHTRLVMKELV